MRVRWLGEGGRVHPLYPEWGPCSLAPRERGPAPEAMEKKKSLCLLAICFPQITNHMEYHVNFEMRRTTCQRLEANNCSFQEGELYKVLGECAFTQGELICSGVCLWFGDGVGWNYRAYISARLKRKQGNQHLLSQNRAPKGKGPRPCLAGPVPSLLEK